MYFDPDLLQTTMSVSTKKFDVFKQFYCKLVGMLPMNDSLFIAKLFSARLLPHDMFEKLQNMCITSADKATQFLDCLIYWDDISFNVFLDVMEDSEYCCVEQLAKEIRTSLEASMEASIKKKYQKTASTDKGGLCGKLKFHKNVFSFYRFV